MNAQGKHDKQVATLQQQVHKHDQELKDRDQTIQQLSASIVSKDSQTVELLDEVSILANIADNSIHRVDHRLALKSQRTAFRKIDELQRDQIKRLLEHCGNSITIADHVKELDAEAASYNEEIDKLQEEVWQLRDAKGNAEFENSDLTYRLDKAETTINIQRAAFEAIKRVFVEHINTIHTDTNELIEHIADNLCIEYDDEETNGITNFAAMVDNHDEKLLGYVKGKVNEVAELESAVMNGGEEIESLKQKLQAAQDKSRQLKNNVRAIREELHDERTGPFSAANLRDRLQDFAEQNETLIIDLETAKSEIEGLRAQHRKKIEAIVTLQAHVESLQGDNKRAKEMIAFLNDSCQCDKANAKIDELNRQLAEKDAAYNELHQNLQRVYDDAIAAWNAFLMAKENQWAEKESELKAQMANLHSTSSYRAELKGREINRLKTVLAGTLDLLDKKDYPQALLTELQKLRRGNYDLQVQNQQWQKASKDWTTAEEDLRHDLLVEKFEVLAFRAGANYAAFVGNTNPQTVKEFAAKVRKLLEGHDNQLRWYDEYQQRYNSLCDDIELLKEFTEKQSEQILELKQDNLSLKQHIGRLRRAASASDNMSHAVPYADENRDLANELGNVKQEVLRLVMASDFRIHGVESDKFINLGFKPDELDKLPNDAFLTLIDYVWQNALVLDKRYCGMEKELEKWQAEYFKDLRTEKVWL
jgi:chromosome segregation ATPase